MNYLKRKSGRSDLFDLIKSMSKAEKLYFHKHVSNGLGEKNKLYLFLFMAMQKQKAYNKEELLYETGISQNQFRNHKKYLHNLVIKSLERYHAESTIDSQLKGAFIQIEILINRGLLSQALIVIQNARKIAQTYERNISLLELLQREKEILGVNSFSNNSLEDLQNLQSEENLLLSSISENLRNWSMSIRMYMMDTKSGIRGTSYRKEMEHMWNSIKQFNHQKSKSFIASAHLNSAICNYYNSKGDWVNLCINRLSLVRQFEKSPTIIFGHVNQYVVALYNLLVAYFNLNKFGKEFNLTLKKLRNIPTDYFKGRLIPTDLQTRIYTFSTSIHLAMLIRSGQIKKAKQYIDRIILPTLPAHDATMNRYMKLNIYYNISLTHFSTGHFDQAQFWIDKIIDDTESFTGDQFYIYARIFNLIINYERGNFFLFEYLARATKRYIRDREFVFHYEKELIRFFKRVRKWDLKDRHREIQEFQKLKVIMGEIIKDPSEKKAMSYFDFMAWIESKLTSKPYIEIV